MSDAFDSLMPEIDNTPTKNFLDDTAADVASKFARHHNQPLWFCFRSKHPVETGMLSGEAAVTEVTAWLRKLEAGHDLAAQRLWDVFFERLVRLAQDRLRTNDRRCQRCRAERLSGNFVLHFSGRDEAHTPLTRSVSEGGRFK
jgi:hypothetical protein